MNQVFLTEKEISDNLFPFTQLRSTADIRVGILTIREKWQAYLGFPVQMADDEKEVPDKAMILAANIIPSKEFIKSLLKDVKSSDPAWKSVKILQYPWHIFQWNDWALREDFLLVTKGEKPRAFRQLFRQSILLKFSLNPVPCFRIASLMRKQARCT